MIRIGEGYSLDIDQTIADALKDIGQPQFIFFMTTVADIGSIARKLAERFPDIRTMGIGSVILSGSQLYEGPNLLVLAVYGDVEIACGLVRRVRECPVMDILQIEQDVAAVHPGDGDTVCIEFCTGGEERLLTTLNAALEPYHIPLIGGTVFDSWPPENAVVAMDGQLYGNACIYAIIRNLRGHVRVYKENIFERRADAPRHQITQVDETGYRILEIDGQPAAGVLEAETGLSGAEIMQQTAIHPLGRVIGKEVYISGLVDIGTDGALCMARQLQVSDIVYFLTLMDYRQIADHMMNRIRSDAAHIRMVFSTHCYHRYLLYQDRGFLQEYLQMASQLGPFIGTISMGEQYNNQTVNETAVFAVFDDA